MSAQIHGWWDELERLGRVLGRVGPDEICCGNLTQRQTSILRTLSHREGARLSDLAAAAGITPSAMTRVIEKLEKQGLVQRVRGAQEDGRAAMVSITLVGRRLRAQLDRLMEERTAAIVGAIPAEARPAVLAALKSLNDAMESCGCCALNQPCAPASTSTQAPTKGRTDE